MSSVVNNKPKEKVLALLLLMTTLAISVMGCVIIVLYNFSFETTEQRLLETVKSHASLIESIQKFDEKYSSDYSGGARSATISQIKDGIAELTGTAEITVAQRDGENIKFILRQKSSRRYEPLPIPFSSPLAEPMRMALFDKTGTLVGLDYENKMVLAAYAPIVGMKLGIVVKMDLSEIRHPFIQAAIIAAAVSLLLILLGSFIFLRLSNSILRQILDNESKLIVAQRISHVGDWRLDVKTSEVFASKEILLLFEFDDEPLMLESFINKIHPGNRENSFEYINKKIDMGQSWDIKTKIILNNDDVKWIHAIGEPLRDLDGEIKRYIGTVQDITEIKQTEETLKQANIVVENSRVVLFRCEAVDGWPVEFISSNVTVFGYTADQFISGDISFSSMVHPDDLNRVVHEIDKYAVAGIDEFQQEYRLISPTGDVFWVDDHTIIERNSQGKATHYQCVIVDISERKHSEEELSKLAQVVEQSPESIVISDLDGNIEYINPAFVRSTGYSKEEVIGKNPRFLQSGNTPAKLYETLWSTLTRGETWQGELFNKKKDGTEYVEFAIITPVRDSNGQIAYYVGVKEDITERKRIGKELDGYRSNLERLVNERTLQLAESQERAELANKAKSSFLANMSHDIRTPLSSIIGLTHLMLRDQPSDKQTGYLTKIDTSASYLLSIINNILDISKIESGKLTLEHTNFPISTVFNYVEGLLIEQAELKGINIVVEENSVPQWLNGDATRLRQALLHYAGNALKFTEQGTITLRVAVVEENGEDLLLRFEVEDTGIGIDSIKLSDLFDSFEQGDISTTRKVTGSGLGLAITQRLVRLMGGEAGVESRLGHGSTFWFTVAMHRGYADVPERAKLALEDESETKIKDNYSDARILLVEDNAINREMAVELLTSVNLVVETAENGIDAVNKVRENIYDMILMDIQMPEMDGIEATRIIRDMKDNEKLPILAMTANILEEDRLTYLDVGMNDLIAKPFDLSSLFSTIVKWLPERNKVLAPTTKSEKLPSNNNDIGLQGQLSEFDWVKQEIGLRNLHGDEKTYLRLLNKMDSDLEQLLPELEENISEKNNQQAEHIAHSFKGSSGTLGLVRLQEASQQLEESLRFRDDSSAEVQNLLENIKLAHLELHEALNTLVISELEHQNYVGQGAGDVKHVIAHIESLLTHDNSTVNDVFIDSEALLKQVYGTAIEELGNEIINFNYPQALLLIKSLKQ